MPDPTQVPAGTSADQCPRENRELLTALREAIIASLPAGPSIQRVAKTAGYSTRTLQRRLDEAGTNYTQLMTQIRCEQARRLLAQPGIKLSTIATMLGFADPGCFSRAFHQWQGMTPRAYRHRLLVAQQCNHRPNSS